MKRGMTRIKIAKKHMIARIITICRKSWTVIPPIFPIIPLFSKTSYSVLYFMGKKVENFRKTINFTIIVRFKKTFSYNPMLRRSSCIIATGYDQGQLFWNQNWLYYFLQSYFTISFFLLCRCIIQFPKSHEYTEIGLGSQLVLKKIVVL